MHPVLARDGVASEAAAFTTAEITAELEVAGLGDLRSGAARPIPWMHAFWSRRHDTSSGRDRWREVRSADFPRLDVLALRLGFSARPF